MLNLTPRQFIVEEGTHDKATQLGHLKRHIKDVVGLGSWFADFQIFNAEWLFSLVIIRIDDLSSRIQSMTPAMAFES